MGDVITTAVDTLDREQRQDLYYKLLAYAGPPPLSNSGYCNWSGAVETGVKVLYPEWQMIDQLDATIRFRHWCGRSKRTERVMSLFGKLFRRKK